jgi:cation:H+ antiporter
MIAAIVQFVIASGVVVAAAIVLTHFSDLIAKTTGLGHLIVGSVLLAAATSLPELSVNLAIINLDLPDMAMGGLIGSSLFNLGILGIADLSYKTRGAVFSRKSVETALPGVVSIAMTAVVGIGIFVGGRVGAVEFGGIGVFSFALLVAYLLGLRLIYRDQLSQKKSKSAGEEMSDESKSKAVIRAVTGFLIAAIVIIVAAPYTASAAETIAKASGLGETFVGTTMVALATSLPELVTCIAAVRIGAMNLAIGNVFGSNTFNLLLLIPLDLAYPGSLVGSVDSIHLLTCMFVMMVTAIVIVGQLYRVESRTWLVEPDAALVLIIVLAGLALIYFCR